MQSKVVAVENNDQLEKVLKMRGDLPNLEKVIVFEGYEGDADADFVMTWDDLLSRGSEVDDAAFDKALAEAKPDWPTLIGRLRTAVGSEGSLGRARATLLDLGLAEADLTLPTTALSGGQRKLIALAACLAQDPDVLLLDEPEAHLDAVGRALLERLLSTFDGAAVAVSHDRYLLDETVSKIAELDRGRIRVWPGNYSAYTLARELELERRGLRYWMADPNLWVPFEDGTSFGQWLDDSRTQANLEGLGVSKRDIEGYWAYEELFDDVRRRLRKGERDTWVGDSPTRE